MSVGNKRTKISALVILQSCHYKPTRDTHINQISMTNTKIPGVSFSLKRAIGVTKLKRLFTQKTGIPTTKVGMERKIGGMIINAIFKK